MPQDKMWKTCKGNEYFCETLICGWRLSVRCIRRYSAKYIFKDCCSAQKNIFFCNCLLSNMAEDLHEHTNLFDVVGAKKAIHQFKKTTNKVAIQRRDDLVHG